MGSRITLVFVTVDPARDTPERLAEYLGHFDERIIGLRSEGHDLDRLLTHFHAFARKVPRRTPGHYTMDHTVTTYLLGPDGRVHDEIGPTDAVASIVRRLRTLLDPAGVAD